MLPARPTRHELIGEINDAVHDVPALLTAPLYRKRHRRWGATDAELDARLPGDELLPHAQFQATRAITIDAPPEAVWPWLVQVGCLRAGWYSNDLLDNLACPSATTILPDFQHLEVGQWIPMSPAAVPSDRTALRVHSFAVDEWLLWTKPDSTWSWRLTPIGASGTRLVTRIHAVYDWHRPATAVLGLLLMEFGDFAMQRRMLRGIKARAEANLHDRPPTPHRFDGRHQSFRARFGRDATMLLARPAVPPPLVTESDLASLPSLLQTYLRRVGAVGRPRVRNLHVEFDAQMRSSATAPWMQATASQYEFFTSPARLFHMKATRSGIPFDILHEYIDGHATFQVRIAGLLPVVNKSGIGITHDETVTLMNDVLVLAPAAVLDLPFTFEPIDARSVHATFSNAGFTVTATLAFDAAGDLVGFVSADRAHDREGGDALWSTPLSEYAVVDGVRVATHGDANWIDPTGEWTYGRFVVRSIAYNVDERSAQAELAHLATQAPAPLTADEAIAVVDQLGGTAGLLEQADQSD